MGALSIILASLAFFALAYRLYGRYLAVRVFVVDPSRTTPAVRRRDDVDYVPADWRLLFGHHFVTIAGLGPIMGPAIAVIWGWLPALLWVLLGTVFMGAVHDLGALVVSVRREGRSIGDISEEYIGRRGRALFLAIIFFLLALAMGVFVLISARLLTEFYPEAVIPVFALIPIAVAMGHAIYRRGARILPATLVGVALMLVMIAVGIALPVRGVGFSAWVLILLVYAYFASTLPVWLLLQPRDYLNSFQQYLGVVLMLGGLCVLRPRIVAPAVSGIEGLPPIFPFLFITVACGAISGFHSLVSSGTTAKQLRSEGDALAIGYGGMLAEGVLAVLAILACTAGFRDAAAWRARYAGWETMSDLGAQMDAFVSGAGRFIAALGIPEPAARVFIAVVVVGFALTTLDSATRLLRYNIEEIGRGVRARALQNRLVSSLVAVLAIGYFAFMRIGGKPAGFSLWQLFGTSNQLLAGLAFIVITLYLSRARRRTRLFTIPMVLMLAASVWAIVLNLLRFLEAGAVHLLAAGAAILAIAVWLCAEAVITTVQGRK
ncbi:MAG: carbon starvation protein A [bacterium]|nr:carbon starvation protein A [bacterium]